MTPDTHPGLNAAIPVTFLLGPHDGLVITLGMLGGGAPSALVYVNRQPPDISGSEHFVFVPTSSYGQLSDGGLIRAGYRVYHLVSWRGPRDGDVGAICYRYGYGD